jgi:hypothetical protein
MAEVPAPSARAPFRVQAGGCHPAASPSKRRAEGTIPKRANARSAFETVPAPWRVHSPRSALPPDANGREMAEARELESQRLRAHALSRR